LKEENLRGKVHVKAVLCACLLALCVCAGVFAALVRPSAAAQVGTRAGRGSGAAAHLGGSGLRNHDPNLYDDFAAYDDFIVYDRNYHHDRRMHHNPHHDDCYNIYGDHNEDNPQPYDKNDPQPHHSFQADDIGRLPGAARKGGPGFGLA